MLAGRLKRGTITTNCVSITLVFLVLSKLYCKVIREKSRGEGSLIGQDTIENVSEPKFFF